MKISHLEMAGRSIGKQSWNLSVEFNGETVRVDGSLIVPSQEEFTAKDRDKT